MIISSWNVNSLRNCENSFLEYLEKYKPDIVGVQELRAHPDQLSFFLKYIDGYTSIFNDSGRPGYAGTALFYKNKSQLLEPPLPQKYSKLGKEGRLIHILIDDIHIFNLYAPNGNSSQERLVYKYAYYNEFYVYMKEMLMQKKDVIVIGDLNVAHTDKDLFPKNLKMSGCLPDERAWLTKLLKLGFVDTFRMFEKNDGYYSWWNLRDPERKENRGWRFDYILASESLKNRVKKAGISREVFGSDHCPVWLELN